MNEYPDHDFPWSFYFNGVLLPKWSSCWAAARISQFLNPAESWDHDIGHRDVWIIGCRIDHVAVIESEEADLFIYAAQEVLSILLNNQEKILENIASCGLKVDSKDVYAGLVEGAFQMRELAIEQRIAFWTTGYEADRERLMEFIECSQLDPADPKYQLPPHLRNWRKEIEFLWRGQVADLHRTAQSGNLEKRIRKRLHEIELPTTSL